MKPYMFVGMQGDRIWGAKRPYKLVYNKGMFNVLDYIRFYVSVVKLIFDSYLFIFSLL